MGQPAKKTDQLQELPQVSGKPAGHRILILPDKVAEFYDKQGRIIRPTSIKDQEKFTVVKGTVLKLGETAWMGFADGRHWAEPGDRVLYTRHAGELAEIDGVEVRIINDEDIFYNFSRDDGE